MPTYRVEMSKSNRALCQNTECKKEGVKIGKGELRFGNWFEFDEHGGWKWKHWGCVTPYQFEQWQEMTEGDMDMVDGFDELPPEAQDKVKRSIDQGHVDDEDWKGDLEMNRDGNKKMRVTASAKKEKAKKAAAEAKEAAETPTKPKSKKRKAQDDVKDEVPDESPKKSKSKSKSKKATEDKTQDAIDDDEEATLPAKKSKKSKTAVKDEEEAPPLANKAKKSKGAVKDDEEVPPPAKKAKKSKTSEKATKEDDTNDGTTVAVKKGRGRPKAVEPPATSGAPAATGKGRKKKAT